MSDRWVRTPDHLPRKCHRTGHSTADAGPYFESNWTYYDADPNALANGSARDNTLYISTEWTVDADEWMDKIVENRELQKKVDELEEKVEALQADLLIALEQEQHFLKDEDIERIVAAVKPKPRAKKA
jgi:hypothetical protein